MRIALVQRANCTCAVAFSDTLMQVVQLQALYCYRQLHDHSASITKCSAMSVTCHTTQGVYTDRQSIYQISSIPKM